MKAEERKVQEQKAVANHEEAEDVAFQVLNRSGTRRAEADGYITDHDLQAASILATCAVARAILSRPA